MKNSITLIAKRSKGKLLIDQKLLNEFVTQAKTEKFVLQIEEAPADLTELQKGYIRGNIIQRITRAHIDYGHHTNVNRMTKELIDLCPYTETDSRIESWDRQTASQFIDWAIQYGAEVYGIVIKSINERD